MTDSTDKLGAWMAIEGASRDIGDEDGYADATEKADKAARTLTLLNPSDAASVFLTIADFRWREGKRESALACVREAIVSCEGISDAQLKARQFATCAGLFTRLGDDSSSQAAMIKAKRWGGESKSDRVQFVLNSIALSEAGDFEQAFAQLREAERDPDLLKYPERRAKRSDVFAPRFAKVANAAAKYGAKSNLGREVFERAYVVACADLARTKNWKHERAVEARSFLAQADAQMGAFDRAWIAALHLPDPNMRATAVLAIAKSQVELKQYDGVNDVLRLLPPESSPPAVFRWVGQAEAQVGNKTMTELKRWAEGLRKSGQTAAAYAGIGVGVAFRSDAASASEKPTSAADHGPTPQAGATPATDATTKGQTAAQATPSFDKIAASRPSWWLDQAIALTKNVDDPLARVALWTRVALAQLEIGDEAGYHVAMRQARGSVVAIWDSLCFERKQSNPGAGGIYRPRSLSFGSGPDTEVINAAIQALLDAEEIHHQHGDAADSLDTLFFALRCAEVLPNSSSNYKSLPSWIPRMWMSKIAGRFYLRGRTDLAELMFARSPWAGEGHNAYEPDERTIAMVESGQAETIVQEETQPHKKSKAGTGTGGEVLAYAQLALLAAQKADSDLYRQNAMKVSGLLKGGRSPVSPVILLELARGAAILGETDLARDYVARSALHGRERDAALADIVEQMARHRQATEFRTLLEDLKDPPAKVRARYAITYAEAVAPSADLSNLFASIASYSASYDKAAAMAAVAASLTTHTTAR